MATGSLRIVLPAGASQSSAPAVSSRDRIDIELMRIVAAVGVISIHVTAYLDLENGPRSGAVYWTALLVDSSARFCVPLFFVLAGWVILAKRPPASIREIWSRIARVFVPFAVWTVLYSTWTHWGPTAVLGSLRSRHTLPALPLDVIAGEAFRGLVLGNPVPGHLWFMGTYVPLIFVLSLVALICRAGMKRREPRAADATQPPPASGLLAAAMVVVALAAAPAAASMLTAAGGHTFDVRWSVPLYSLAFAVVGATLLTRAAVSGVVRMAAGALFVLTLGVTMWWSQRFPGQTARLYDSPTVAVSTVSLLVVLLGAPLRGQLAHWARTLGRASFGIYLVHVMVLYYLHKALDIAPLPSSALVQSARLPLEIVVTFAISAALCLTWRRSPRLARVLG